MALAAKLRSSLTSIRGFRILFFSFTCVLFARDARLLSSFLLLLIVRYQSEATVSAEGEKSPQHTVGNFFENE